MKKILIMLSALVILLSLCACGNKDNHSTNPSDMSQATTNSTEGTTAATQSTTEATQTPTEATDTTDATDATTSAPTEDPTAAPTQPSVPETPTGCDHTWNNATCTTPKTCSKCGVAEGEPAEHIWKDATCTDPQICTQCDTIKGEATGHQWNDATCTAPKTCTACGATEGTVTEHSWIDATCTAPKTCSACGATEGDALAHSWGEWYGDNQDPCTEDSNEYRHCSLCNEQEQRTIKASHDYQEGFCTRCDARDESYAFTYIDFKDKLFEAYIKQNLGIAVENGVAVEDMKKLTSFTIEKRVTDVEELKYATSLESITILASNVNHLDALSGLPVKQVTLNCEEIDVTFMSTLKEVETVNFHGCKLTGGTMEDVVSSPKLTSLYLDLYWEEQDIDFLSQATGVEQLTLYGISSETDLSVLTSLSNLKNVSIYSSLTEEQYLITDQLIISGVVVDIV